MSDFDAISDIRNMISQLETSNDELQNGNDEVLLKFVENCIFLESQAHHWHLQSESYTKHMVLDDFYKELPEYVDSMIEGLMSERGAIMSTGMSFIFSPVEEMMSILESINNQCKYIHDLLDADEEYGSLSSLDDMMSFLSDTIYKLKVLK